MYDTLFLPSALRAGFRHDVLLALHTEEHDRKLDGRDMAMGGVRASVSAIGERIFSA